MTNGPTCITPQPRDRRTFLTMLMASGVSLLGVMTLGGNPAPVSGRSRFRALRGGLKGKPIDNLHESRIAPQVPYIYWSWGEIRRGDCTIAPGAVLQLFADGSTRWKCDLRSSDSGDEWDGRFEITNANGQVLAATPNYHFDISQENVTRHWEEFRGPNASLAAAYPNARGINFFCSC